MHPDVSSWDESSFLTFMRDDINKPLGYIATTASIASNFGAAWCGRVLPPEIA
jgi:hypothetical protein